jgi:hypothetical protein
MSEKTRQQRRAESREAASLLLKGRPRSELRWEHILAFLGVATGVILVLVPPESQLVTAFWIVLAFSMLVYPTFQLVKAVLRVKTQRLQILFALIFLSGLFGFLSWWLFRPMPIELQFSSSVPLYGSGSDITGIRWKDRYSYFRLLVRTVGDADYDSLDMSVTSDLMFADLRQENGVASCVIAPEGEPFPNAISQPLVGGRPFGTADATGDDYTAAAIDRSGQLISISGNIKRTYRIRCEKFPAHSQNSFVGALVVVNPFPGGKVPTKLFGPPRAANQISATFSFKISGHPRNAAILNCKTGQTCKS